jgi:cytidylate kinase
MAREDVNTNASARAETKPPTMRAITISREYGAGGGEIARGLAKRLDWQLVDHALVTSVAETLGENEEDAEQRDERGDGFSSRLIASLQWISPWGPVAPPPLPYEQQAARRHQALIKVILATYDVGNAVIVGRGGQRILGGHRDVLHVRIVAPLDARVAYVIQREQLSADEARARIAHVDRDRQQYLEEVEQADPRDAQLYDLVVNTAVLSLDDAVDLIVRALRLKEARLGLDSHDLGPAAGLPPYPGPVTEPNF